MTWATWMHGTRREQHDTENRADCFKFSASAFDSFLFLLS